MAEESKKIAIIDLCETTLDITPRRYREMAKQGIVPPVVRGKVDAAGA